MKWIMVYNATTNVIITAPMQVVSSAKVNTIQTLYTGTSEADCTAQITALGLTMPVKPKA